MHESKRKYELRKEQLPGMFRNRQNNRRQSNENVDFDRHIDLVINYHDKTEGNYNMKTILDNLQKQEQ